MSAPDGFGKPIECDCRTHCPHLLAQYLSSELDGDVALIGIQPRSNAFDTPLSPEVLLAVDEVVQTLRASLPF